MSIEWQNEAMRLLAEAERLRGTDEDATMVLYQLQQMGVAPPPGNYTVMMQDTPSSDARILASPE